MNTQTKLWVAGTFVAFLGYAASIEYRLGQAVGSSAKKDLGDKIVALTSRVGDLEQRQVPPESDPVFTTASSSLDARLDQLETQVGVPTGTIAAFGGTKAPAGWEMCDGRTVDLQETGDEYGALSKAIGSSWGKAGPHQLRLPDLRGVFLRGADGGGIEHAVFKPTPDPGWLARVEADGSALGDERETNVGTFQFDGVGPHSARIPNASIKGVTWKNPPNSVLGLGTGGSHAVEVLDTIKETRPRNAAVHWIIKL